MNRTVQGIVLIIVVAIAFFGGMLSEHKLTARSAPPQPAPVWEYRVIYGGLNEGKFASQKNSGIVEQANRLGEEGWELVTVFIEPERGHGYDGRYIAYLKRRKP
ncbi:MAG: DUF4177 domain-containing protein [Nitrososphaera sp.]|nr:DUF4177 domain-containing protein [Nitrososphaera sp.]